MALIFGTGRFVERLERDAAFLRLEQRAKDEEQKRIAAEQQRDAVTYELKTSKTETRKCKAENEDLATRFGEAQAKIQDLETSQQQLKADNHYLQEKLGMPVLSMETLKKEPSPSQPAPLQ